MNGPQLLEDEIGRKLREAELSGELRAAKGYGEPLPTDTAWEQTPEALRLPFKVLKVAGVLPAEVLMLKKRAALREALSAATDAQHIQDIQAELSALEISLSLRLASLRG